jgi:hypothetical protein
MSRNPVLVEKVLIQKINIQQTDWQMYHDINDKPLELE